MKTKAATNIKKQNIVVRDLKTKKNPKGGASDPVPGVDIVVRKHYPHK